MADTESHGRLRELAGEYLSLLHCSERQAARRLIMAAVPSGIGIDAIYLGVL
mgnify:FL=1